MIPITVKKLGLFPGWALLGMLGTMLVGVVLAVIMMLKFMKSKL